MNLEEFHTAVLKEANKYNINDLQHIVDVLHFARSKRIKLPLEHRKTLEIASNLMLEIKRLCQLDVTPFHVQTISDLPGPGYGHGVSSEIPVEF